MLVVIDYSMIVLFFGVLLVLLIVIASPRANAQPSQAVQTVSPPVQEEKLVYGLLLALFILLFVLSWYTQRAQTHASPP